MFYHNCFALKTLQKSTYVILWHQYAWPWAHFGFNLISCDIGDVSTPETNKWMYVEHFVEFMLKSLIFEDLKKTNFEWFTNNQRKSNIQMKQMWRKVKNQNATVTYCKPQIHQMRTTATISYLANNLPSAVNSVNTLKHNKSQRRLIYAHPLFTDLISVRFLLLECKDSCLCFEQN